MSLIPTHTFVKPKKSPWQRIIFNICRNKTNWVNSIASSCKRRKSKTNKLYHKMILVEKIRVKKLKTLKSKYCLILKLSSKRISYPGYIIPSSFIREIQEALPIGGIYSKLYQTYAYQIEQKKR